ncbi:glycosyltransferase [Kribbella hippodromi]|uniref:Glycosyltransferase n=1 Tax=Kribbella hippodromi TaxID=434347 RepID=A0ABN2CRD0_9ACTN
MDILILTHGTRGDVQPFVALGCALTEAGHSVRLGAPAASETLVRSYGLQFVPIADGPNKLSTDPIIREAFETNYRGLRGKGLAFELARKYRPMMDEVLDDLARIARDGADLLVYHVILPGQQLGEWLGIPALPVCMQPFWAPTSAFQNPMHALRIPTGLYRLSYRTSNLWYQILSGHTRRWRTTTLGLPARRGFRDLLRGPDGRPVTLLQAFSAHLLAPMPADYPSWVHTTGFWRLPAAPEWSPPRTVADFLAADSPVVYVGFGSMAGVDPERTRRTIVEAVRLAGVRAVVATGWGGIGIGRSDDNLLFIKDVPHDWLFSRVSVVVHHGGSGTSGAALAAGRPQVVCPFFVDQPYFAQRIHALGAAPPPLPQRDLNPVTLARAIETAVNDSAMAVSAAEAGHLVRAEEGVDHALKIVEAARI